MHPDDKTLYAIETRLKEDLVLPVEMKLFTTDQMTGSRDNRGYNQFAGEFLEELAAAFDPLSLVRLDLFSDEGKSLGLAMSPTILVGGDGIFPIQYWGAPTGNLGGTFIEALVMTSRRGVDPTDPLQESLHSLSHSVLLECFVTTECPYCPGAVHLLQRAALASGGQVTARIIEITQGMDRALRFDVVSVPHLVMEEDSSRSMVGLFDEKNLATMILDR